MRRKNIKEIDPAELQRRIRSVIISYAKKGETLYYSTICNELNIKGLRPNCSCLWNHLTEISRKEHKRDMGLLSVIVRRKKDNLPGVGFERLLKTGEYLFGSEDIISKIYAETQSVFKKWSTKTS